MYSTIIHATDLQENHFDLAKRAKELSDFYQANLILMHVLEPPASLQVAQSLGFAEFDKPIIEDAKFVMETLGEALNISKENQIVKIGSIRELVLQAVQQLRCDLIVIGRHTPNHIPSFLGSTAYGLLHQASCDVLIMKDTPLST